MTRTRNAIRVLSLSLVLGALVACGKAESRSAAPAAAAREQAAAAGPAAPRKALLEVRLELAADVTSGEDATRLVRALEARTNGAGGYVESSTLGEWGSHLVLRVPTAELDSVRGTLASNGPLSREVRTAKDVTDAVLDLDARVKSAKLEETRLLDLLQNKTGNLADVLAVEKALAEVRERIERMETEQRSAHARVDLAVVDVSLTLRGALEGAPVGQRLIVAGREGVAAAREAVIVVGTTTLRVAPTGLMLFALVALIWRTTRSLRSPKVRQSSP